MCIWMTTPRPHRSRAVTAYLQSEAMTCVPWPVMSPIWFPYNIFGTSLVIVYWLCYFLSVGIRIASGMTAAITAWHPTSNWRDETQGWSRHPSTCGLHPVLNNRCRQVIHKWRFESEMTILSCCVNCEGQYLKWTCFTAKTGLVILWLNIH